ILRAVRPSVGGAADCRPSIVTRSPRHEAPDSTELPEKWAKSGIITSFQNSTKTPRGPARRVVAQLIDDQLAPGRPNDHDHRDQAADAADGHDRAGGYRRLDQDGTRFLPDQVAGARHRNPVGVRAPR